MQMIPIIVLLVVGLTGFCLMIAAFVLAARHSGWQQAMKSVPQGKWPLPRRLMFVGASLGVLFSILLIVLFLIPGGIPRLS